LEFQQNLAQGKDESGRHRHELEGLKEVYVLPLQGLESIRKKRGNDFLFFDGSFKWSKVLREISNTLESVKAAKQPHRAL
ncbi:hypothetical protein TorRG33x02_253370, partial [Trema orientale]